MKQLDGTALKRLHREWRRRTKGRIAIILDGVGTPVNVGSIVRSAAAYGVDYLWCAAASATPASAGAAKTALGTDRYVPWEQVPTTLDAIEAARAAGFEIVALELTDDATPLHENAPREAVCLVVGHEDHGLTKATLALCDRAAFLPMVGRVGSLNVATATAIALYELRRHEWSV
jgi:tRNA (guanosine-2'-O-)-methyltransferase